MGAEESDDLGEAGQFSKALFGKILEKVNRFGTYLEKVNLVASSRDE